MSALVMTDQLYTVKEIADILKLKPRTVRTMIAQGEIKAIRVRDEWRIKQSALDTYLDNLSGKDKKQT